MSNTKLWAITILGIVVGWVLFKAAPALKPAFIAIIIAYLLYPLVEFIQRKLRVKKWLAITILLVLIFGILSLLMNLILPPVVNQASQFIRDYQAISRNSTKIIEDIFVYLEDQGVSEPVILELQQSFDELITWLGNLFVNALKSALGAIFTIIDIFLVFIMVIYFLASGKEMVFGIVNHTPEPLRRSVINIIEGSNQVIWNYVRTQFLIALIVGAASTAAYLLIGVRYAFLLGAIAGILIFIPYFGAIIAGTLATVIALLTGGLQQGIITLIAFLVIQQIEGNLITPRLQGKSTGLNPAIILIIILVGNHFWGTIGMFVAVPLFGLARLFVAEAVKLIRQLE